jgi:hypothetical protein
MRIYGDRRFGSDYFIEVMERVEPEGGLVLEIGEETLILSPEAVKELQHVVYSLNFEPSVEETVKAEPPPQPKEKDEDGVPF